MLQVFQDFITQEEEINLKNSDLLESQNKTTDYDKVEIVHDKSCRHCQGNLLDIKLKQQENYSHVIVCGKCFFWLYRWGV